MNECPPELKRFTCQDCGYVIIDKPSLLRWICEYCNSLNHRNGIDENGVANHE